MRDNSNIKIAKRFQRSIEISKDIGSIEALDGYICPPSALNALRMMINHSNSGQCAFAWVGPYGSGKSSLALALLSLFSNNDSISGNARQILGLDLARKLSETFKRNGESSNIVPIIGRRESPLKLIYEGLKSRRIIRKSNESFSENDLLNTLSKLSCPSSKKHTIIIFDELGKSLEHASKGYSDVYLFQQVAEIANRSESRLIFIGILHQSFTEYVNRAIQQIRDDWRKVQGRFVEIPLSVSHDETISLISNAINNEDHTSSYDYHEYANIIIDQLSKNRVVSKDHLQKQLIDSRPLHPIVTCLLGPISRRRFSQNQRSVFSFLSSSEPNGFSDFLQNDNNSVYMPYNLWDYYKSNLEPAILVSPDGHRWTIASTAIEKCQALGLEESHLQLLKTIALVHLFGKGTGLEPKVELLATLFEKTKIIDIVNKLVDYNLITYREQSNSYALFSGSDFDLEGEVSTVSKQLGKLDYDGIESLSYIQPFIAKRHYHETGTLRWVNIEFLPITISSKSIHISISPSIIGKYILFVPDSIDMIEQNPETFRKKCQQISKEISKQILVGYSDHSLNLASVAKELMSTERVRDTHPAIAGDEIARREIKERIADLQNALNVNIENILSTAEWFQSGNSLGVLKRNGLTEYASLIAFDLYNSTPIIKNELLNRTKPSGSAISAQNALLRRMINYNGDKRLGIDGYPAEGGLFDSLLINTQLYNKSQFGWEFTKPEMGNNNNLYHLWKVADDYLKKNENRAVMLSEIYECWEKPPIGIKSGLKPFFAITYIITRQQKLGVYKLGIYQTILTDVFIEELVKNPELIQLRWMILTESTRTLLRRLPEVISEIIPGISLDNSDPLNAARSLVSLYDNLPEYTKRTNLLSRQAIHFRNILKRAKDPNKLLFNELPNLSQVNLYSEENSVDKVLDTIRSSLLELAGHYEIVLKGFRQLLFEELHVENLENLRKRAKNVYDLIGDKIFDGFASRISRYHDSARDIEGLVSFCASKPAEKWIDIDVDKAKVRLAELSIQFLKAEGIARIKSRPETRHEISFIVSDNGTRKPIFTDFSLSSADKKNAKHLAERIENEITNGTSRDIVLAALSMLGRDLILKRTENE